MKTLLGKIACRLIRAFGGKHKWRRLRKKENAEYHITGTDPLRICDRCLTVRAVKQRKVK